MSSAEGAMQASLHPCEICGEPAVEEVELTPAIEEMQGEGKARGKVEVKKAVMVWACAIHLERIEEQRGWQEREKGKTRRLTTEAKERLRRDQLGLFGEVA